MGAHLIGLDIGTSAIKAVAISSEGEILRQAKACTELLYPGNGRVEFAVGQHYEKVRTVLRDVARELPKGSVAAAALSGASGSTILVDEGGEPLLNAICWMDERARVERVDALEKIDPAEVHRIAGWPFSKIFPLANLAWLKERMPGEYSRKARFCTDIDYACHALSGEWAIDFSAATPTYLLDQLGMCWHRPYLDILELSEESVSRLVASGSRIGKITPAAGYSTGLGSDTELVAGAFDHPSAAIGAGVFSPDSLLISTGTSWVGFFPTEDRAAAVEKGLLVDPFMSHKGGCWGAIFSIPKIGGTVDSLLDKIFKGCNLAPQEKYSRMAELASAVHAGSEGIFIDLSSPPERLPACTEGALCRAIMESAAYMLRRMCERYAGHAGAFKRIVMCGGPSQSRVWTQIVADVTGIPLEIAGGQASGAIGAAILAGVGSGIFKDERDGFNALKLTSRKVEPAAGVIKIYDGYYRRLLEEKKLG